MDKERLAVEMAFKDSSSFVIRICKRLPDFLQSVKLKYVKLGYGYSCNPATVLIFALILPLFIVMLVQFTGLKLDGVLELWTNQSLRLESVDAATRLAISLILFFLFGVVILLFISFFVTSDGEKDATTTSQLRERPAKNDSATNLPEKRQGTREKRAPKFLTDFVCY
ncbi:hypothetical protein V6N13_021069 [Hibiscus sabdariffa]|uniref:Uncharacterized protein n=1 Tax=Hibiscus sabdariffa TaxID=183260 RepID=A0ABR2EXB7_9ROSI